MLKREEFQKEIEGLTKEAELEHSGKVEIKKQPQILKLPIKSNEVRTLNNNSSNRLGEIRTPKIDLFDGENPHEGHRQRKKKSADSDPDFATFSEVEMLEYLLYNTIPRIDTNEIAHLLIRTFGSYYGVLNAHVAELKQIPHINESTARMLASIISASRKAEQSRLSSNVIIKDTLSAVDFIAPYYTNRSVEYVYLTNLNNHDRVISMDLVGSGDTNYSSIDTKKIIESACRHKATKVLLSHNHPSGGLKPSIEDIQVTQQLLFSLLCAKVVLVDHIIISQEGYYSFFANKEFDKMYEVADSVFKTNLVKESRSNRFNYRKSLEILTGEQNKEDGANSDYSGSKDVPYTMKHSKVTFDIEKREDEKVW